MTDTPFKHPRRRRRRPGLALALLCAGLALQPWRSAHAVLQIDITQGVTDPIAVAIVPFARAVPADGGFDVAAVVQRDLEGSGRFRAMARRDMLSQPTRAADVQAASWHAAGNDYAVVGRVGADAGGGLTIEFDLVNVLTGQRLGGQRISATAATLRNAAHRVADFVYEKILGMRGAFATRIAYVAVGGQPPAQHFQLIVADADGENARIVLDSRQPIMSPAWSPDGQWLAYVSFENRVSSVYVQRVRTGERRQVSARVGVNGAPAWSPDGARIALTLSGSSGNLDIYVLELATQQLTRFTNNPAIDTEPAWTPRRPQPVLHLGPRRRTADLPPRAGGSGARAAHQLRLGLQCAAAPVAGRPRARLRHARGRALPHRAAGPGVGHGAAAVGRQSR